LIVYTANYGNVDFEIPTNVYALQHQGKPAADLSGIEFVYFTDRNREIPGWNVVVDNTRKESTDLLRSKWFKLHSHELFPNGVSMYLDGNRALRARPEVEFAATTEDSPVTLIKHYRPSLHHEFQICIAKLRFHRKHWAACQAQLAAYMAEGLDVESSRVYHGNTLTRHPNARAFNELWWEHVLKYCPRDQLSLAYVVWRYPELVSLQNEKRCSAVKIAGHATSTEYYGRGGRPPNRTPKYLSYRKGES